MDYYDASVQDGRDGGGGGGFDSYDEDDEFESLEVNTRLPNELVYHYYGDDRRAATDVLGSLAAFPDPDGYLAHFRTVLVISSTKRCNLNVL